MGGLFLMLVNPQKFHMPCLQDGLKILLRYLVITAMKPRNTFESQNASTHSLYFGSFPLLNFGRLRHVQMLHNPLWLLAAVGSSLCFWQRVLKLFSGGEHKMLGEPSENPCVILVNCFFTSTYVGRLFLNIAIPPSFPKRKKFPVKVYIHGGYVAEIIDNSPP